ncbi:hypothetical protein [Ornithinimicrobium kibberense]|uniref:hypothetical protein n=1 Tax=Ornithinimicrobium kibberense TaxID=282060 RepID=UPI00361921C1
MAQEGQPARSLHTAPGRSEPFGTDGRPWSRPDRWRHCSGPAQGRRGASNHAQRPQVHGGAAAARGTAVGRSGGAARPLDAKTRNPRRHLALGSDSNAESSRGRCRG